MAKSSSQESSSSFDLDKLRTELECCICLCLFEDPRQLTCNHICCAACLQPLIDMANDPGVSILFGGKSGHKTIKCPQCRKENQVPADGKFPPTAFVVKNLVSHVKQAEMESKKAEKLAKIKCSTCDKSVLYQKLFYCLDCNEFDEKMGTDEEEINSFLMTKLICSLCFCTLHKQHKIAAANEAKEAIKEKKQSALQTDSGTVKEQPPELHGKPLEDPKKLAKAEELRLKGNEAYWRNIIFDAIKFYTLSIRECPTSVCLSDRARANIYLARYSVAYVDATEALYLDPNNEQAKKHQKMALHCMGEIKSTTDGAENEKAKRGKTQLWPNAIHICAIELANEGYIDEGMVGLVPQNVICVQAFANGTKSTPVPLNKLDLYLNDEHVYGSVAQVLVKFVKFDEQMVQVFRRIKPERFQKVNIGDVYHPGNQWLNCDFSLLSEASFRFLFDSHLFGGLNRICIADWTGLPAGYNYNSLFKLRAFRDALEVKFALGAQHNPPVVNLHLDKDVLIDFLHSPGFRSLDLFAGQLHEGFDSFLKRLKERFQKDTERRFYEVTVRNVTKKTKQKWLNKPTILSHPANDDELFLQLGKPEVRHDPFAFHAGRHRNEEDEKASRLYNSNPASGKLMISTNTK